MVYLFEGKADYPPHAVARQLRRFGIRVVRQRVAGKYPHGHSRQALLDAILKYRPGAGFKVVQVDQTNLSADVTKTYDDSSKWSTTDAFPTKWTTLSSELSSTYDEWSTWTTLKPPGGENSQRVPRSGKPNGGPWDGTRPPRPAGQSDPDPGQASPPPPLDEGDALIVTRCVELLSSGRWPATVPLGPAGTVEDPAKFLQVHVERATHGAGEVRACSLALLRQFLAAVGAAS